MKLATLVSGRKNVARPFVRRKQVSTRAEIYNSNLQNQIPCRGFNLLKILIENSGYNISLNLNEAKIEIQYNLCTICSLKFLI